jgi:hypothetical protein
MEQRGQVSAYDIFAAVFLFMLAFITLRGIWLNSIESAERAQALIEMKMKTMQAIDSLLKTTGYPNNWDGGNVELIGLAQKENVLSRKKMLQFAALDYGSARELLQLGNYDFRFELHAKNSADDLNVGMAVDNNSTVVSLKRTVEYGGAEASVLFKVFTE